MLAGEGSAASMAHNHAILPTVILVQTLVAWVLVGRDARTTRAPQTTPALPGGQPAPAA